MAERITVTATIPDARAKSYLKTLKSIFPTLHLNDAAVTVAYTINATLTKRECESVAKQLTNPLVEEYSIARVLAPESYAYAIEIGYLPGVTDNVWHTAKQTAEDCLGRRLKEGEDVYSSVFIFLTGGVTKQKAESAARELQNPLIERAGIMSESDARISGFPIIVPKVTLSHKSDNVSTVDLNVSDAELAKIGKEGIKNEDGIPRGPLALSLRAMKVIKEHFAKLGRSPTDIELESLAQTWSEHCKHTIFADPLDEVKEGIYRRYIKGATQKIRKQKGPKPGLPGRASKKDFCVSVFTDNSGAIAFNDEYLVTHKVETHNSPSALDPFGGSVTAIVGVNRDTLGFGLGAKPIANVYGFCVSEPHIPRTASLQGPASSSAVTGSTSPDDASPAPRITSESADSEILYRDSDRKQALLPARRILEGVVNGINAGGNQSGIPTPLGFVAVDPSYRGKPLVYGGTVGLIPRKQGSRTLYEKKARHGDYIVMI